MPKIHVLDKSVAELIAAGEVVERPASIVKELVENAIDAGASDISVEIKGGGIGYIRVTDNGSGIDGEDLPRAFLRHATSKVFTEADLGAISTLGFRGEALASIAAVSRVELITKADEADSGFRCKIEGGGVLDGPDPYGCPNGTTMIVRDVFYNTPARMKFLKRDITEGNAVAQIIDKYALAHPEIAFRMIRDTQTRLQTSGNGDLLAVIAAVYDREISSVMTAVDYTFENQIHVSGFVGNPSLAKPSRAYQNFFLNGRYIRSRTCSAALEEAFKNRIMSGKFPVCVLEVTTDPTCIDVNVHPAKIEVRFSDEKSIFNGVYFGVKSAFSALPPPLEARRENDITPLTLHFSADEPVQQTLSSSQAIYRAMEEKSCGFSAPMSFASSTPTMPNLRQVEESMTFYDRLYAGIRDTVSVEDAVISPQYATNKAEFISEKEETTVLPDARLIGELFGTYILLQQGNDLVVVDKHAAHEGIIYQNICRGTSNGNRQVLLEPVSAVLNHRESAAVIQNSDILESLGFLIEDFGGGTVIVRETPSEISSGDIPGILSEIAGKMLEHNHDLTPSVMEKIYYSIACKSAVRAGERNSPEELEEIVRLLSLNPQVAYCPHGRPIVTRITKREMEKRFGRLG